MLTLLIASILTSQSQSYIWIEGESHIETNIPFAKASWGRKEILSEESLGQVMLDAGGPQEKVPAEGGTIKYKFSVGGGGDNYEIWNRIGYEWIRSSFQWRIDQNPWQEVKNTTPTTDLMAIQDWNEIAWIPMGKSQLSTGEHTLEIRIPKVKDQRLIYASDAVILTTKPFRPYGKYKPDQNHLSSPIIDSTYTIGQSSFEGRPSVALKGDWQIARDDEFVPPADIAQPMTPMSEGLRWKNIKVPSNKNTDLDLTYAHRVWYKTTLEVPQELARRGYQIKFPANNLNTTVYVNGQLCGFEKNPYVSFWIDISKAVKPGKNELVVGIRDAYYGLSANPNNPMKLRKGWNIPQDFLKSFADLAYPIWNSFSSGILATPIVVASGTVYAEDVFVKPSVAKKALDSEVTVKNTTSQTVNAEIVCQAVDPKTGEVAATLPSQNVSVQPNEKKAIDVNGPWMNPTLWWPDQPHMYDLRTLIKVDGKVVDTRNTPFGFREWTIKGTQFLLNGIVYRVWADLTGGKSPEDHARVYRETGNRTIRHFGMNQSGLFWNGLPPDEALDFMDKNGIVNRRSGALDGEVIGYMAVENDPDLKKDGEIKMELFRNWHDQMLAQVKGERNHPSIMLWSLENEFLYINCINLYGGLMDDFEREVTRTSDAVRKLDPTRATMVDGGGALKAQTLPVHGDHYVFGDMTKYPTRAFEAHPYGGGRGRWVWDQKRPRYIGEDYFANGINPADFATLGGEYAFLGKAQAREAGALIASMLTQGYRWQEYAAWHMWLSEDNALPTYFNSFKDRAVFTREWDSAFASGKSMKRTYGVFNDTRFPNPLTFKRSIKVGKTVIEKSSIHNVSPGTSIKFPESANMPAVSKRTKGTLTLKLLDGNKEIFKDTKTINVLPEPTVTLRRNLAVIDPSGKTSSLLKKWKIKFTKLNSLAQIPGNAEVILVGSNALSKSQSVSPYLSILALQGKRVVVLDQENPLQFQGIPADVEPDTNDGRVAFFDSRTHPIAKGLDDPDLFTFPGDEVVYKNAYLKPKSGGKSLIQCDNRLENSALLEIPVGQGLMVLSQLQLTAKSDTSIVARTLFANILNYADSYQKLTRTATSLTVPGSQLEKTLSGISLNHKPVASLEEALATTRGVAVIEATPKNLANLAAKPALVKSFNDKGGWIVLNNLKPDGLASYNKLVGFDHMIRPSRRERVTFPVRRHPLTSGLTNGDIVLLSSERLFDFTSDYFVADDMFHSIVDLDEVAAFPELPNDYFYNTVNGFVSADAWKYIFSFEMPRDKPEYTMKFSRAQTFTDMEWIGNAFYHKVTKFQLIFDGKDAVTFEPQPNNSPQNFKISPPRTGKNVELKILDWTREPGITNVVGIDNIRLTVQRPANFSQKVQGLLDAGGLVSYPRGQGGILLANLQFKANESVPLNGEKKKRIFSTLLRNLDAPIGGQALVIPGAGLTYTPVDISKSANQYRNERGWFGDRSFTFKDFPTGSQLLGGVRYSIYEFLTSPVPTSVMLGGPGVPGNLPESVNGIKVGQTARALFFLHTARVDRDLDDRERREKVRPEVAIYRIKYADGSTLDVPVRLGQEIDSFRQTTPKYLPGAALAWSKPFENSQELAVAYAMQWTNPKPKVAIASVDLLYGKDRRVVPALLAITAAK